VKVTKPNLKKLDDRSKKMIFVRYEPGSAAYRCYDPDTSRDTSRVHISRDVIFYEDASWDWVGDAAAGGRAELPVTNLSEDFQIIGTEPNALFYPGAVDDDDVDHSGGRDEIQDGGSNHERTPLVRHPSPASRGVVTPPSEASIQSRSTP
jgi:hypothetical protein